MTNKKTTYASCRNIFKNKINGYQTLVQLTSGVGTQFRPTPAQLNTFSRWIEKGAMVHKVSQMQLNRWAGTNKNWTPGSVKTTLCNKFGKSCIKAVVFNSSGGFIVATSPTRKGKTFRFNG